MTRLKTGLSLATLIAMTAQVSAAALAMPALPPRSRRRRCNRN